MVDEERQQTIRLKLESIREVLRSGFRDLNVTAAHDDGRLHSLGIVDVEKNWRQVRSSIDAIRTALSQHHELVVGVDDRAIRKYLTSQSDFVKFLNKLENSKKHFSDCQTLIKQHLDLDTQEVSSFQTIKLLKQEALALDLQVFVDYSPVADPSLPPSATVQFSSPSFFVEVSVSSSGEVESLSLSFTFDDNIIDRPSINETLTAALKARNWSEFRAKMAAVTHIAALVRCYPKANVLDLPARYETDLMALVDADETKGDREKQLSSGLGVIETHSGLQLLYSELSLHSGVEDLQKCYLELAIHEVCSAISSDPSDQLKIGVCLFPPIPMALSSVQRWCTEAAGLTIGDCIPHSFDPSLCSLEKLLSETKEQAHSSFSFVSCTSTRGLLAARLPIGSVFADVLLKNLGALVKLLRQQIVFNRLYRSCFCPNESVMDAVSTAPLPLCELSSQAPEAIDLTVAHPSSHSLLNVHFDVLLDGVLKVSLTVLPGEHSPCSDEYATQVANHCLDIPLTLDYVLGRA